MPTAAKKQYQDMIDRILARSRDDVKVSKLGRMQVLAWHGRAFVGLWQDDLVVRLYGVERERALKLKGAAVYEAPGGAEAHDWVRVPVHHVSHWRGLIDTALIFASQERR